MLRGCVEETVAVQGKDQKTIVGQEPAPAGFLRVFYLNNERAILGTASVAVFLILWEIVGTSGWINSMFTSAPSRVFVEGIDYFTSGLAWNDIRISAIEFFWGYALAVLVGVPVGILMGWYQKLNHILDPFVIFFFSTPRIAFLPVLVIWFGIGVGSKIAIVFMMAVIPFVISTISGVRTIDNNIVMVARSFGASDRQIFQKIVLPGAVPSIVSGLRLGIGLALIGTVVGEMYAANAGVGYRLMEAGTMFKTDLLFVCVFIIAGFGMVVSEILVKIESRFDKWRPERS